MLLQKYVTCRSPLLSCDWFFLQHPFTEVCSSSSPHTLVGRERSPENSAYTHASIHKWYGREASVHSARSKWHSLCLSSGIRLEDRFRDCCILFFPWNWGWGQKQGERWGGCGDFEKEGWAEGEGSIAEHIQKPSLSPLFLLLFTPTSAPGCTAFCSQPLHLLPSSSPSTTADAYRRHTLACSLPMTLSLFSCPPPPPLYPNLPAMERGNGALEG